MDQIKTGALIRQLRLDAGLTQKQLAEKVVYAVAPEPPARTPRATLPHFESHFHRVENHNKKEPA